MKSEKTAKELVDWLRARHLVLPAEEAPELAAFLGVELTPERVVLPGWSEGGLEISGGGNILAPSHREVVLGTLAVSGHTFELQTANRVAFVEIHRRWLAAKRRLEKLKGCGTTYYDMDWRVAGEHALRILRGEG